MMCRNKTVSLYLRTSATILFIFLVIFVERSSQQCTQFSNSLAVGNKNSKVDLYSAQHELSLIFFNAINNARRNGNVLFSPYSIFRSLLSAYFLAGGQTERYLKKVLRLEDVENKFELFPPFKLDQLVTQAKPSPAKYDLTIATKLFVSQDLPIRECILSVFPEELEKISFRSSPEAARNAINRWTENASRGMIENLFAVGTIDQNTDLVLVDAASLKGSLERGFDRRLTRMEVFYIDHTRQVLVPMMYLEGRFGHGVSETFGAHVLEMPYKEDVVSLYVLLPPFADNSMESLLNSLTAENLRKLGSGVGLTSRTVQVGFPKLNVEATVDITAILQSLVVGNFFESNVDLSLLGSDKIAVGQGVHKARIEITEQNENTTAGLTELTFTKFICNHPFVYVIYNKKTSGVLFMGIIRNPIAG